jgi:hypothetical protein
MRRLFVTALLVAGCSRRDAPTTITSAPDEASPPPAASLAPAPTAEPAAVANPLAMPLKHDGAVAKARPAVDDPCAVRRPTGALAMPLKHDGQPGPAKNPLCMRLK